MSKTWIHSHNGSIHEWYNDKQHPMSEKHVKRPRSFNDIKHYKYLVFTSIQNNKNEWKLRGCGTMSKTWIHAHNSSIHEWYNDKQHPMSERHIKVHRSFNDNKYYK